MRSFHSEMYAGCEVQVHALHTFVRGGARLEEFGQWFFAKEEFQRPAEFVVSLRRMSERGLAEIADAIARDRPSSET